MELARQRVFEYLKQNNQWHEEEMPEALLCFDGSGLAPNIGIITKALMKSMVNHLLDTWLNFAAAQTQNTQSCDLANSFPLVKDYELDLQLSPPYMRSMYCNELNLGAPPRSLDDILTSSFTRAEGRRWVHRGIANITPMMERAFARLIF